MVYNHDTHHKNDRVQSRERTDQPTAGTVGTKHERYRNGVHNYSSSSSIVSSCLFLREDEGLGALFFDGGAELLDAGYERFRHRHSITANWKTHLALRLGLLLFFLLLAADGVNLICEILARFIIIVLLRGAFLGGSLLFSWHLFGRTALGLGLLLILIIIALRLLVKGLIKICETRRTLTFLTLFLAGFSSSSSSSSSSFYRMVSMYLSGHMFN